MNNTDKVLQLSQKKRQILGSNTTAEANYVYEWPLDKSGSLSAWASRVFGSGPSLNGSSQQPSDPTEPRAEEDADAASTAMYRKAIGA